MQRGRLFSLSTYLRTWKKEKVCTVQDTQLTYSQLKGTETILEPNRCIEVSNHLDSF